MTAGEFEERVATALRKRGWVTGPSFKGIGMDMFACAPDGAHACIQCHSGKNLVEAYAIRDIIDGKKRYGCQTAAVVTEGGYTWTAISIAAEGKIRLMRYSEETGALEYAYPFVYGTPW